MLLNIIIAHITGISSHLATGMSSRLTYDGIYSTKYCHCIGVFDSVVYQVREIIMLEWTNIFSSQGPEHCHIEFCKKLADCSNNKDMFLTLLHWHVRAAHLQYLSSLEVDMADAGNHDDDPGLSVITGLEADKTRLEADKNDRIFCELGFPCCYPTLQCIVEGRRDSLSIQVHASMLFYSASSTKLPSLYFCRAENVLGRVPLMPCYISGNTHPTLPHRFSNRPGVTADFSMGRGNRSRLYELNLWVWLYASGWGQPHKVTVSMAQAVQRRRERLTESCKRAVQTLKL
jgi:hypothetical protein